jgi:mRNA interferase HigB
LTVVGLEILSEFTRTHAEVRSQGQAWLAEAEEAQWRVPEDIKRRYRTASFLSGNRVVFNLKGRKYRMVVKVSYQLQIVMIERMGTHAEYSKWEL